MAFKKTKKYKPYGPKQQFSIEQRFSYHFERERHPLKNKIKYGGPKHSYSTGYREAFSGHNNESGQRREFGQESGNAYIMGYRRGERDAYTYWKKTGKQPNDLIFNFRGKK